MTGRARGRLAVAALAVAAGVAMGACAPAASSHAPSSAAPGVPGGSGPDWLSPVASDGASCATPGPSGQTPICAEPGASDHPSPNAAAGSPADGASGAPTDGSASAGAGAGAGAGGVLLTDGASSVGGASPAASATASPSAGPASSLSAGASPAPVASAAPSEDPGPPAAPTSASGFKVRDTIVPIAFPLPASAAYRYGDGWRAPRVGVARPYNQIRGVAPDGTYLRAHDGLDIPVKLGTPVLATFSGTVIDPAKRWKPWDPSRYGKVVVIESTEPTSPGYRVIFAHLSSVAVKVGDMVERGEVVGRTGRTGNAAGTVPHLHIELRAPFLIRYGYAKVIRRLDVFDAEPSVRAADPKTR